MTQTGVVARLAVRELWISYRLLVILVAFIGSGAIVALMPAPLGESAARLAVGLGLATALASAITAWSVSEEVRAGRAGWLVSRALSRSTLLAGWFVAIAAVTCAALVGAAMLGWLTASSVSLRLEPSGYVALIAGVAAAALAAVALGLLAGILARPRFAAPWAAAACTLVGLLAWSAPIDPSLLPGGAYAGLASLTEPGASVAPGLRATGAGLAATAGLLALARMALDRVDL